MPLRHTTYINLITDGKIYKAYMFPRIYKHRGLYNWSFRIAEKRKGQIAKEIKDGMEYLCHYNIIKKQNNNGRDYFLRGISK